MTEPDLRREMEEGREEARVRGDNKGRRATGGGKVRRAWTRGRDSERVRASLENAAVMEDDGKHRNGQKERPKTAKTETERGERTRETQEKQTERRKDRRNNEIDRIRRKQQTIE